ncbi:EAL domain, c-di-GMP-specific phosphodiesterase class I (or its enzymatically inactive variant) [Propionivibrio dicarboxylicus]|uniref:EAL domain, c-di-GMP-specific phosphodiesterase class I (Or its enzymatically inactive variant) n=2 Tax=Propionivibrio dicarboxylicus TaxID=83767 RepID=A0A1G8GU47_9RHOO|nr:EAL domain, c-di-GMP-specific phosphodiesterase class I (or its enzymatically inactive variant) [Propionivibrio dicarboxylicus]
MTTQFSSPLSPTGCDRCRNLQALDFDFTMAFQPIMNLETNTPFAYEALVRGLNGEGAATILAKVNDSNRYRFDQACRVKAIELAAGLGLHELPDCHLSINFLPNAVYRPDTCIRSTLEACSTFGFPSERLMFEVAEGEHVSDASHLLGIFRDYSARGFLTAIDDFGAGYAGLNLLARFQPHILKIDMELTREVHRHEVKRAIVEAIVLVSRRLNIRVVAEGIETAQERDALVDMGILLHQGYLYARPHVGALPLR